MLCWFTVGTVPYIRYHYEVESIPSYDDQTMKSTLCYVRTKVTWQHQARSSKSQASKQAAPPAQNSKRISTYYLLACELDWWSDPQYHDFDTTSYRHQSLHFLCCRRIITGHNTTVFHTPWSFSMLIFFLYYWLQKMWNIVLLIWICRLAMLAQTDFLVHHRTVDLFAHQINLTTLVLVEIIYELSILPRQLRIFLVLMNGVIWRKGRGY